MQPPKTIHIHHPSGKLYDAFRRFSEAHPDVSYFQSDAFFRLATGWAEAEVVLFIAVKGQKLKDPGGHYRLKKPLDLKAKQSDTKEDETFIAGSLMAVILHEPALKQPWLRPFRGIHQKLTARTIIYGGPLLGEGTRLEKEITLKTLVRAVQDHVKKRSVFTEFRNLYDVSDCKPIFRENNFQWQEWLNLLIDTSPREKAWTGMSDNRRRQVKKSLDAGAEIVYTPGPEQIDAFYDILKELYAKKVRKPLPSRAFFHLLAKGGQQPASNQKPASPIILITHQERVIAGIACPVLPGKVMYEWYVCGLDKEYNAQDIYPSVLATWAAIEHAARQNIPVFNFLGMGKPNQEYGVRDFKIRFGGRQVEYGRFFTVNRLLRYALAKLAYNIKYGAS